MSATALILEKLRRDSRRAAIEGAVKRSFVFLPHRRWTPTEGAPRVRRAMVYAEAARAVGLPVPDNRFCIDVRGTCERLGAVPIRPFNRHCFAFMQPMPAPGTPAFRALERAWREKAGETFEDIEKPGGALKRLPDYDPARAEINSARMEQAAAALERLRQDTAIMEAYCEGLAIRPISERMGISRFMTHKALTRLLGGHPGDEQDTDDNAEGELDR